MGADAHSPYNHTTQPLHTTTHPFHDRMMSHEGFQFHQGMSTAAQEYAAAAAANQAMADQWARSAAVSSLGNGVGGYPTTAAAAQYATQLYNPTVALSAAAYG